MCGGTPDAVMLAEESCRGVEDGVGDGGGVVGFKYEVWGRERGGWRHEVKRLVFQCGRVPCCIVHGEELRIAGPGMGLVLSFREFLLENIKCHGMQSARSYLSSEQR